MTGEVIFVPLLHPSERAARKIPPLEGRVASGVSRKPDDGRGDLRSVIASVETNCDPIRHLFRRLRRHLPLEGKDLGVELVPFLRPSERTARKIPPLEGRVASGVSRKPDDGRGDFRSASASVETNCDPVRHLFRRLRRHLPLEGKDLGVELVPFSRPSERAARKSLPLRGGWHPASHASRMTEEVIFVPLSHSSQQAAIRYVTSSVACGDTFPSRGRTWGVDFVPFLRPSERAAHKIPPLEGRGASGVPRKPDDGRGDLRSVIASDGTECFLVRHLFRRLRRHLPLEGKDFVPPSGRQPYGGENGGKNGCQASFFDRIRAGRTFSGILSKPRENLVMSTE